MEEVLTRDPLHLPSLAEAWFLADRAGKAVERVTSTLRGEAQSYLELACDNARFRLYAEVCELLSFFASRCPKWKADAMACYRLA